MARCNFDRVLAYIRLTSQKGDEQDHMCLSGFTFHGLQERFGTSFGTSTALAPLRLANREFVAVLNTGEEVPHQFLGVISEYIFSSLKSVLFLLTTSFMILFGLFETLVIYATCILYNE